MSLELTTMQKDCIAKVMHWYEGTSQEFVLAGYAGTGKSTILDFIVEKLEKKYRITLENIAFATFTGKAALVITQKSKGKYTCETLHHLLYNPIVDKRTGQVVGFEPKPQSDFEGLKLVIVDECSMVSRQLLTDLRRIGVKILFVGDHGQLPPVGETSDIYTKLSTNPDYCLTEIHRQAQGNPIIYLSQQVREGKKIQYGSYNKLAFVIPKANIDKYFSSMMAADIVLCGYNKTRQIYNQKIRNTKGFTGPLPVPGEKLINKKNRWGKMLGDTPLINGMIGYCEQIRSLSTWDMSVKFRPEFLKTETFDSRVLKSCFCPDTVTPSKLPEQDFDFYDFGYVITCHASQGSQWNNVFVIDEVLKDMHQRWLYTAITRASEKLILCI